MKKLIFLLLVFTSTYIKAQFLDSSIVLLHDFTIGYNRFKTFESQFQGSPNAVEEGTFPVFTIAYSPAVGKMKNNHLTFFGLKFQYSTNRFSETIKDDTTSWSGGIVIGKKYFIALAKNLFIAPAGFVHASYGKETLRVTAGTVAFPTNYDLDVYSAVLAFQPIRIGYKLSNKSLFEINLFQSELRYINKSGSRAGTTNKIERSYIFFGNRFLSNVQISFMHRLK